MAKAKIIYVRDYLFNEGFLVSIIGDKSIENSNLLFLSSYQLAMLEKLGRHKITYKNHGYFSKTVLDSFKERIKL